MSIKKRKEDHIRICLNKDVNFQKKNGFENYELINNTLVDFKFSDVDISTDFLGHKLGAPLIISSITGGCVKAEKINKNLAIAAQKFKIAMSCGSQKAMIADKETACSYQIRNIAPDILYFGNIGLDFLKKKSNFIKFEKVLKEIEGDGVFVHLNLAQELVQREGERNFYGSYRSLEKFVKFMNVPVLVKEVGFGISGKVAAKLQKAGMKAIDIAGAGGTSWTKVESFRQKNNKLAKSFSEWGTPTAESLMDCRTSVELPLIASGGIYDGITACKAFALGADLIGIARPLLKAANISSEKVIEYLENYILELKTAMMLVGVKNLKELKGNEEIICR